MPERLDAIYGAFAGGGKDEALRDQILPDIPETELAAVILALAEDVVSLKTRNTKLFGALLNAEAQRDALLAALEGLMPFLDEVPYIDQVLTGEINPGDHITPEYRAALERMAAAIALATSEEGE